VSEENEEQQKAEGVGDCWQRTQWDRSEERKEKIEKRTNLTPDDRDNKRRTTIQIAENQNVDKFNFIAKGQSSW